MTNRDAKELLKDVNEASKHLAVLHLAYLAICAYVLVIVLGTTDLNLLIGKLIRLPIVDVEVPLTGFYLIAPWLLVLLHFNLLFQLQILSRKLHVFNADIQKDDNSNTLRDRLYIFPYTYYLIGRTHPIIKFLLAWMIPITFMIFPMVVLFSLQIKFLAYQNEFYAWSQRLAIWTDLGLLVSILPISLSSSGWSSYLKEVSIAYGPSWRLVPVLFFLFTGLFSVLFLNSSLLLYDVLIGFFLVSPLVIIFIYKIGNSWFRIVVIVSLVAYMILWWLINGFSYSIPTSNTYNASTFVLFFVILCALLWNPVAPRGSFPIILTVALAVPVSLGLMVDGERLEDATMLINQKLKFGRFNDGKSSLSVLITKFRQVDVSNQILFSQPPESAVSDLIRSGKWEEARYQVEPINLENRSLRHARLRKTVLIGAILKGAHLEYANLSGAHLEDSNLSNAFIDGIRLREAHLESADLSGLQIEKHQSELPPDFINSHLEGAKLNNANLEKARFAGARFEGASMSNAHFEGANFAKTHLDGADLNNAHFEAAHLSMYLSGTILRGANIYAAKGEILESDYIDLEGINTNIEDERKAELVRRLGESGAKALKKGYDTPLLQFQSCLAKENNTVTCKNWLDPDVKEKQQLFIKNLHQYLVDLTCESPDIARGIIKQIISSNGNGNLKTRIGLDIELQKRLNSKIKCWGLERLKPEEIKQLDIVKEKNRPFSLD
jgi:uncharacterized protein YjbI with pentapeptide repeats